MWRRQVSAETTINFDRRGVLDDSLTLSSSPLQSRSGPQSGEPGSSVVKEVWDTRRLGPVTCPTLERQDDFHLGR